MLSGLSRACLATGFVLAGLIFAAGQERKTPSAAPARPPVKHETQAHVQHPPAASLPPDSINLGGKDVSLTEIVPRAEESLSLIEAIRLKTQAPELAILGKSVQALGDKIEEARSRTALMVRDTRSTQLLMETRTSWLRDLAQWETLNGSVERLVQGFAENQQQLRQIEESWTLSGKSPEELGLPEGVAQRIEKVQVSASSVSAAVRSLQESFVDLQVKIVERRKQIDESLQMIDSAREDLRGRILVIDAPPIWSVFQTANYSSLRGQAQNAVSTLRSRLADFYFTFRNNLLIYLLFVIIAIALVMRLRPYAGIAPNSNPGNLEPDLLLSPAALAIFLSLSIFAVFFPKVSPEILRISQLLMVFPLARLSRHVFEGAFQRSIIGLCGLYVLDVLSSQVAAGTLLRRLIVTLLTLITLSTMAWLLRRGGMIGRIIQEQDWTTVMFMSRIGMVLLGASLLSDTFGSTQLADILTTGTVRTVYSGVTVFLMYLSVASVLSAATSTHFAQKSHLINLRRTSILRSFRKVLALIAWTLWIVSALLAYQISEEAFAGMKSVLNHSWSIGALTISLKDVVLFALVLAVSSLVARMIRTLLQEELLPRTGISQGVAQSASRLVHYTLTILGLFLAMGAAGIDLGRMTLLTGAFGVGLGFGLQNLVSNFVSGIILSIERPMQVGDMVEVGNLLGKVTSIGFRSSNIRTEDGAEVIVPNSDLITRSFVNWSLTDRLRRGEIQVSLLRQHHPEEVMAALQRVAENHPDVVASPPLNILFEGVARGRMLFLVRFWTVIGRVSKVKSDLHLSAMDALDKLGDRRPDGAGVDCGQND